MQAPCRNLFSNRSSLASLYLAVLAAALAACSPARDREAGTAELVPALDGSSTSRAPRFADVTAEIGIDFVFRTGVDETYPMPAVMGGGAAVFDADGDDDLDLYFVAPAAGGNRFYRQEKDGRFVDLTAEAGLAGDGMGAATGDLDNDGDPDLYLTRAGPDRLLLNDGNGVFVDRTEAWNAATPGWSSSAALLDFDRDGWLDVYVARYVAFDPKRICSQHGGRRDFCGPTEFGGLTDVLLHNQGGTGFVDVSVPAEISSVNDAGLGVLSADFDHDGRIDIYVANDADPNNLWVNQGDGTFVDEGVLQGSAFNRWGNSEAGMGIAAGDADLDQDLDLLVTHLITETNTYYRNLMLPGFEDATIDAGLGPASLDLTGFGTAFFDADNDGDLDRAIANGAVKRRPSANAPPTAAGTGGPPGSTSDFGTEAPAASAGLQAAFWADYVEPNQLLLNADGPFRDVSDRAPWTELGLSRSPSSWLRSREDRWK